MRIFSFSLVSWLGPESPFLFVWIFNTIDAILLSWCAILKKDRAYTLLNVFWILVGIIGIFRAIGYIQINLIKAGEIDCLSFDHLKEYEKFHYCSHVAHFSFLRTKNRSTVSDGTDQICKLCKIHPECS